MTCVLGGHTGNNDVYYLELLLPPLILKALKFADGKLNAKPIWQISLFLSIFIFCIYPFKNTYATNFTMYGQAYAALDQKVQQCQTIYDSTPLSAGILLDNGRQQDIYNNGQVEYAESALVSNRDNPILRYFWLKQSNSLQQQLSTWNQNINNLIDKQNFDCIFLQSSQKNTELKNYKLLETLPKILGRWSIDLWVPK